MAKTVKERQAERLAEFHEGLTEAARDQVRALLGSSQRRASTPLGKGFVRTATPGQEPPLAQIISRRGRSGDVALGLYLGLVRRSSREPWDTNLSARRWATLLDLEDPGISGARRIHAALDRLAGIGLIEVTPERGTSPRVTLLRDDGSEKPYQLPSDPRLKQRYLQVPDALWNGYIQHLSAPALAFLLVLLAEPQSTDKGMWWAAGAFPQWYGLSESARTRGAKELKDFGLLHVKKQMLDTDRGLIKTANGDQRDRVRNLYLLKGDALKKATKSS